MITYQIHCDKCGCVMTRASDFYVITPIKANVGYAHMPEVNVTRTKIDKGNQQTLEMSKVFCSWRCAVHEVQGEAVKGL